MLPALAGTTVGNAGANIIHSLSRGSKGSAARFSAAGYRLSAQGRLVASIHGWEHLPNL